MKDRQESDAWANYEAPVGSDEISCERSFVEKLTEEAFSPIGLIGVLVIIAVLSKLISFLSSLWS